MKSIGLVFVLLISCFAQASEESAAPTVSSNKAFQDRVQKMNKLDERIKGYEESFRKLVIKKRQSSSSEEKLKAIDEMKQVYAAYEKDMDELENVRKDLKYRFPSEGQDIQRSYSRIEKKSPEELEKTVDLGTTLTTTKLAVDDKYKSFMPPKPVKPRKEKQNFIRFKKGSG